MKKQICALLLLLALLLSACGHRQNAEAEDAGPWYTADYHLLATAEETIYDLCISGDRIWCSAERDGKSVLWTWALDGSDRRELGEPELPEELLQELVDDAAPRPFALTTLLPGPKGTVLGLGYLVYDLPGPKDPALGSGDMMQTGMRWESRLLALCLDAEGVVCASYYLPEGELSLRPVCDRDGDLYLPGDGQIRVFDPAGRLIQSVALPGELSHLTMLADGRVAAVLYASNGLDLRPVDLATGNLGKETLIPGDISATVYPGAFGWDALVDTGSLLYGVDLNGEQGAVLTWLNVDLDGNGLIGITGEESGESAVALFSSIRSASETGENAVAHILRTDRRPKQEKTVLTMACMGLDRKLAELVLRFDRSDPDYRIEVRDYSAYNSAAAPNAGYTLLGAEIISGKIPDLFATRDLPVRTYAERGLLADLWPYIDGDAALGGRDALMLPVFEAMSQGGKLYQVSHGFRINTVLGPKELVGDTMGWSIEDFRAAWAKMPEGASIMEPWMTRLSALSTSMCHRIDDLVDRGKGSCRFDGEEFRDLVRYTELFPEEPRLDPSDSRSEYQRVIEQDQMLISCCLTNFEDVTTNTGFLRDQAVYVGLPGASGNGSSFEIVGGLAMSASSEHQDACWRFLRMALDRDEQMRGANSFATCFPTNRQTFEILLEREMQTDYLTDEKGEYILDANGDKIPRSRGGRQDGANGEIVLVYPMTQTQADALLELIDSTTCVRYWDDAVMDIVIEEIGAYYQGGRSLDAACASIQKRVTLYLREQG